MAVGVVEVDDSNFNEEILQSEVPVVVDFWAEWCGPCVALAPHVEALAQEYSGRIKVAKLNVDKAPMTAQKFRIQAIPTLIAYEGGQVVKQIRGPQKRQLAKFFEAISS